MFRLLRVLQCRRDQRFAHDIGRFPGFGQARVIVHHAPKEVGVEAAPVDADAHRLAISACRFDHGRELIIAPGSATDIAGIDPVFIQYFCAIRVLSKEFVAVEMKIADQRHPAAITLQHVADFRYRRRRFCGIDRDAHEFRTGFGEFPDLACGGLHVRGIGIGHRLHDYRRTTTDRKAGDTNLAGFVARNDFARHK